MRVTDVRLWFILVTIAAMLAVSYAHAQWLRRDYSNYARQFVAEIAHVDRVVARTASPRLVLAGGSSVVFGIDAGLVGRELGVRAVNLGMPNSLGSEANYIDYLLLRVRRGDVVLYTSTHWWLDKPRDADRAATREAQRLADRLWTLARIDLNERHRVEWPVLLPFPDLSLAQRLRPRTGGPPATFPWQRDDYGSMIACRPFTTVFAPMDAPSAAPPPAVTQRSRQLVRDLAARGVRVVFFETRILIAPRERAKWLRYRRAITAQLTEAAPVVSAADPNLLSADPQRFCDGASHASDAARGEWSRFFASQLKDMPVLAELRSGAAAGARIAGIPAGSGDPAVNRAPAR